MNTNLETGIRYGTVYLDSLQDWVWDEFWNHGYNLTSESALKEFRTENPDATDDDLQEFWDSYECEEEEFELETGGMKLGLSWLGGAALVWVFQSPHTTRARLCSPCVPNAGNLNSPDPDGYECYTLPSDWFFDRLDAYGTEEA